MPSLTDRLRSYASDKMPEDSSEVATDEGDDDDFKAEMERAWIKGYKFQQSSEESAGEVLDLFFVPFNYDLQSLRLNAFCSLNFHPHLSL